VGENLQDQPNVQFSVSSNTTFNGTTGYVTYGSTSDFFGNLPKPSLDSWALQVSNAINSSISESALKTLFVIQFDLLAKGVPDAEVAIDTSVQYGAGPSGIMSSASIGLMPFSRGNVHIGSSDPLAYPILNPNYFLVDFDLKIQIAIAKWTRKFWETQPIGNIVTEIYPGFGTVPANATDHQWGEWIKSACA
jgi:hypothetical protein